MITQLKIKPIFTPSLKHDLRITFFFSKFQHITKRNFGKRAGLENEIVKNIGREGRMKETDTR